MSNHWSMLDTAGPAVRSVRFDRTDWFHLAGMAAFIVALTATGWGVLVGLVAPGNFSLGDQGSFGAGLGLTA